MYRYGLKNAYRPSALAPKAYGWSGSPDYNRADVPTSLMHTESQITFEQFQQQFAYEWFQSGDPDFPGAGYSNPPFVSGAAGRLHPLLRDTTGQSAKILRGYIRRAQTEAGDPVSKSRLYFMFNPETITRDYVSYLDQAALDPFNTVFQAGNLVAPPSMMDFSFDLFFDRQEEAQQKDHPGVFVDYQYFDLVVRNVVPTNPNASSNTLPDNGVMMVNPRDITVIFSPQITVQGRPLNARISFDKFTHRMTPTRMRIQLTMRVIYIGPLRDMTEYTAEAVQAEASIPLDEQKTGDFEFPWSELTIAATVAEGAVGGAVPVAGAVSNWQAQTGLTGDANSKARQNALAWAIANVQPGVTRYTGAGGGANRYNLPYGADCSGLVAEAYVKTGLGAQMQWSSHPGTQVMHNQFVAGNWKTGLKIPIADAMRKGTLEPGDLFFRIASLGQGGGHTMFFTGWVGDRVGIFAASSSNSNPQVGAQNYSVNTFSNYSYAFRPMPHGVLTVANQVRNNGRGNTPL